VKLATTIARGALLAGMLALIPAAASHATAVASATAVAHVPAKAHHRAHLIHHHRVHRVETHAALQQARVQPASAPLPVPPPRHGRHSHHSPAMLPGMTHASRNPSGFKTGQRGSQVPDAAGVAVITSNATVVALQNEEANRPAPSPGLMRGPPRAGPSLDTLPASDSRPGRHLGLAPSLPLPDALDPSLGTVMPTRAHDPSPCVSSYLPNSSVGQPHGRPHARRLEGTAARSPMPSA
jgi:hypothetical protein